MPEAIAQLTYLEALPKVRAWFTRPGAQYGWDGYNCVYRGGDDVDSEIRCGIGCLIPDELYDPDMENTAVAAHLERLPFLTGWAWHWERLQSAHDRFASGGFPVSEFIEWIDDEIERGGPDA